MLALKSGRIRIRLLILLLPGLHLRELHRLIGMSFNSTRYHVDRLAASGEILRVEEGGYSRLYPAGTSEMDKRLFALIRRPTDRQILARVVKTGKVSQQELCKSTGFAKSTISEHLTGLAKAGVLEAHRVDGTKVEYELTDPARIQALISVQNPTLLRKATDRFIDLWDF